MVSVGVNIDDEEILHIVLQGLPTDFHSFTSAMLTKNEQVRFEELHTLMKTEEDLLKSVADNSKELTIWLWLPTKALPPLPTTLPVLRSIPSSMLTEEEVEAVTIEVVVDLFRITTVAEVISTIPKIPNLGTQTPTLTQPTKSVTSLGTLHSTVTKG